MSDIACLHLTSLPLLNGTLSAGRVDAQLAGHCQISISNNTSHTTEGGLPVSICCAVIITAVRKRLIRKKNLNKLILPVWNFWNPSVNNYHSLPSIHNKPAAERETKYSQTFVQQSPFGNGIKVTVIYTAGDRYIQVNFAENKIKATGNFGKLSGDRNIKGDCYIYTGQLCRK